jgi:hypothetical protein
MKSVSLFLQLTFELLFSDIFLVSCVRITLKMLTETRVCLVLKQSVCYYPTLIKTGMCLQNFVNLSSINFLWNMFDGSRVDTCRQSYRQREMINLISAFLQAGLESTYRGILWHHNSNCWYINGFRTRASEFKKSMFCEKDMLFFSFCKVRGVVWWRNLYHKEANNDVYFNSIWYQNKLKSCSEVQKYC